MDGANMIGHGNETFIPKLRRNKKIDKRWGQNYYMAVRSAVFMTQNVPYVPAEPPPSLSEDVSESEPLYVCKCCRDCFRFSTSFEDHTARRSWILGYWCQYCFLTMCSHVPQGANPCTQCFQMDKEKRSYIRNRSCNKKNKKLGATKVFYNQCQFFAHVKMHNLNIIDISDIMLMPVPDMEGEWTPTMHRACEALMENAFLLEIHIMDWLKANKVEKNWWSLVTEGGKNPVTDVMKIYQGDYLFKHGFKNKKEDAISPCTKNLLLDNSDVSPDIEIINQRSESPLKNSGYSSGEGETSSDQNISENEDNPCTPADIAFVDCGPTPKFYSTEPLNASSSSFPTKRIRTRINTCFVKSDEEMLETWQSPQTSLEMRKRKELTSSKPDSLSTLPKCQGSHQMTVVQKPSSNVTTWKNNHNQQSNAKKCKMDMESEMSGTTVENTVGESSAKAKFWLKTDNNVKQVSPNKKVLTFQRAKDVYLTSIMKQLPPYLLNNRKIVFIGQDNDGVTIQAKPKESLPTAKLQIMPDPTRGKVIATVPKLVNVSKNFTKTDNQVSKKAEIDMKSLSDKSVSKSKIVYQNGRKYIIKQSSVTSNTKNVISTPSKVSETDPIPPNIKLVNGDTSEIILTQQGSSSQNETSPLTPSPSLSELSTSSSETYSKQLSEASKIQTINEYKETKTNLITKTPYECLSFRKGKNGAWYLNIKLSYFNLSNSCTTNDAMPKHKREMIQGFNHLTHKALNDRIEHLQKVREELLQFKGTLEDRVITESIVMINEIRMELEAQIIKRGKNTEIKEDTVEDSEVPLTDWEEEIKDSSKQCPTCGKILKPKSYIAGISKLSKNENIYCACYRNVCHLCNTYQGYVTRFIAHQNYHDKEKPYACPDCWRRFSDFRHLNVHTWLTCFHTLSRRSFGCKICEIDGFPDVEAMARHFVTMHAYKKIACETCYVVLPSYEEYKRHCQECHAVKDNYNPTKLIVCRPGQCIVRYENVMSLVEKHCGVRRSTWFKCPFCTFLSYENKKITTIFESHLQNNHLDRLPELMEPQTLIDVLPNSALKELSKMYPKLFADLEEIFMNIEERGSFPKIVNTRTITPEVFERGPQETENDNEDSINFVITKTTKQDGVECNVFSINADESEKVADDESKELHKLPNEANELNSLPKILDVRSIAKGSEDSENSEESQNTSSKKDANSDITKKEEEEEQAEICKKTSQKGSDSNAHSINPSETVNQNTKSQEASKSTDSNVESTDSHLEMEKQSTHSSTVESQSKKILESTNEDQDCIILSEQESTLTSNNKDNSLDHEKSNTQIQIRVKDIEKLRMTFDDEIEEIPSSSSTPKPPPLSRIPQHLLNPEPLPEISSKDTSKTKNPERPWRIALNGPITENNRSEDFLCHLCGQLINTSWPVMSDHFKTVHSEEYKLSIITPRLLRVSPDFIKGGYKGSMESSITKKRKSESTIATTRKRRRWSTKKYADPKISSLPDTGLCVKQETAKEADGTFKCKKCDHSCESMTDLRDHIASSHRIKGRYLICLECGENFVVAPSLQMHLKAFHGIEDPITYMTQNTSYAPDIMDDIDGEGKTTVANQCHVCMAVFEDKAAVDKHLRVHGMAFLNRKRIEARNAQMSTEKRTESEQKVDSSVKNDKKSSKENAKVPAKRDNPAETILEKINAMI